MSDLNSSQKSLEKAMSIQGEIKVDLNAEYKPYNAFESLFIEPSPLKIKNPINKELLEALILARDCLIDISNYYNINIISEMKKINTALESAERGEEAPNA